MTRICQVHPSVFTSNPRGPDVEASGPLWIDADTGRILQSELLLGNDSIVTRRSTEQPPMVASGGSA